MSSVLASEPVECEATAITGDPIGDARELVAGRLAAGSWTRPDRALLDEVRQIVALRAQVDALLLDAVGEVDTRGLATTRGCSSTRAWLRAAHRIPAWEAGRLVRTAATLRTELPAVGQALAGGAVSLAQAETISAAIADLPAETQVARRGQAEATMIGYATTFDPVLLARIGRRLAEIIDPDGVQARDEKPILDKEADAHRDRTLTLTADTYGAGGWLKARLDAVGYATIAAYLDAATTPGQSPDLSVGGQPNPDDHTCGADPNPVGPAAGDPRTVGQRRHDAAVEAFRQMLSSGAQPSCGGVKPRIVLTIPAASLSERSGAGRLAQGCLYQPQPGPATLLRRRPDHG